MPNIAVGQLTVPFPFEPYPAQVAYMEKVVTALDRGVNALLESPTGTGKTLCLLCSTLAWVMARKTCVRRHKTPFLSSTDGATGPSVGAYKVVYCSRTHAQLTQVIRELKRALSAVNASPNNNGEETGVSPLHAPPVSSQLNVAMALLGSREHMCVNAEVSKLPSTQAQQSMCNSLRANKGCRFFRGLQVSKASGCLPDTGDGNSIYDVEDVVREGKKGGFCPYYLERELAKEADIVFMPYNYVLDYRLRKQLPFDLKDCILVVDEAHNLPSVLSASGCLDLQALELANAIQDCSRAVAMQRLRMADEDADRHAEGLREQEFASLKILLARLEECIAEEKEDSGAELSSRPASSSGGSGRTASVSAAKSATTAGVRVPGEIVRPGAYIEDFLRNALITRELYEGSAQSEGMCETVNNAVSVLVDSEKPASGLVRVQQFLSAVFSSPLDCSTRFVLRDSSAQASSGASAVGRGGQATGPRPASVSSRRSLGFWRLDNSAELNELSGQVHCMLLTSGTLSPLDHFAAELGADFPVRLSGSHIIGPDQVLGSVLCRGPSGDRLNGSYAFRNSVEYRAALGMSLVNVCRVTPGGTLVFFPSYTALNSAVDLWRSGTGRQEETKTVWGLLSELKPVFVEPTSTGELTAVVSAFQKAIRDSPRKGAVLLAVCRGKVSEGIDFADNDGRCVIVTGIPFANHTDLFVRLKREYLTQIAPQRPKVNGALFTGDSWYRNEAMRAVNQSVGRVIRHKDDYGAVVLADERFAEQLDAVSEWVAKRTTVHRDFRDLYPRIANFFSSRLRTDHGVAGGHATRDRTLSSVPATCVPRAASNLQTSSVPLSAELAKNYAAQKEKEAREEASRKVEARWKEAAELPETRSAAHAVPSAAVLFHTAPSRGTAVATVDVHLLAGARTQVQPALSPSPMQRQGLPGDTLCVSSAEASSACMMVTAPRIGPSSKEFCSFLKERVSSGTYSQFKSALGEIAALRRRAELSEDAIHLELPRIVDRLQAIFAEASKEYVLDILLEFGRHIPDDLRTLYSRALRKRTRPTD